MHELMTEGNPGLTHMHQRMMSGTGMSAAPSN
jgi:hypothetical protein